MGGTERTTVTVATGLTKYCNCRCYSVYTVGAETPMESCFHAELKWEKKEDVGIIKDFIREHQIDWIIDQGDFFLVPFFKSATNGTNCKVAFVHHFEPGWEEHFLSFWGEMASIISSKSVSQFARASLRTCLYPVVRWRYFRKLHKGYNSAYQNADKTVLLCKGFIPQYMTYGNLEDDKQFDVIPNGLSYEEYLPIEYLSEKKPVALIVSRLSDPPKRLSLALQIWKEIKRCPEAKGWLLKIVGHGPDEKKYRQIINQQKIPDVSLLGRKQPKAYYEEASIFLMTSRSEGWGLTLTEAQQFGVVPIAFNSYASLEEIITDDEDGIVIPECDVKMYIDKLLRLMCDKKKREGMAIKGIENCQRFSQEKIAMKWWKLLTNS